MRKLISGFNKTVCFSIVLFLLIAGFHCAVYAQAVKNNGAEEASVFMTDAMTAAYQGDSARLKTLLEKGANADASGPGGTTLLMLAAMSPFDNAETISLLIKYGARYDKVDENGVSALTIAKNRSNIESAAVLESFYTADRVNTLLLLAYLFIVLINIRLNKSDEDEKEPLSDSKRLQDFYYTGESFEKISGRLKDAREKFQH